jgi:riboflavin synthase
MFTGIISQTGRIAGLTAARDGARLSVQPRARLVDLTAGESIAVNGVCLTAETASQPDRLEFFLSDETLRRTTLGDVQAGDAVNLERALRADDRLGGHLVMGHVDAVGTIDAIRPGGNGMEIEVGFPHDLGRFIAVKGSIAVDGISLTVSGLKTESFTVSVIPHTAEATKLKQARPGTRVNLEADMMARYVVRYLEALGGGEGGLTREKLLRAGFGGPVTP